VHSWNLRASNPAANAELLADTCNMHRKQGLQHDNTTNTMTIMSSGLPQATNAPQWIREICEQPTAGHKRTDLFVRNCRFGWSRCAWKTAVFKSLSAARKRRRARPRTVIPLSLLAHGRVRRRQRDRRPARSTIATTSEDTSKAGLMQARKDANDNRQCSPSW